MSRPAFAALILALPVAAALVPGAIAGLSPEPAITVQGIGRMAASGRAGEPHHEAGSPNRTGRIHPVFGKQVAAQGVNDLSADREPEAGMLAEVLGLGAL